MMFAVALIADGCPPGPHRHRTRLRERRRRRGRRRQPQPVTSAGCRPCSPCPASATSAAGCCSASRCSGRASWPAGPRPCSPSAPSATAALAVLPESFNRPLAVPTGIALIGLGVSLWRDAARGRPCGCPVPRPVHARARGPMTTRAPSAARPSSSSRGPGTCSGRRLVGPGGARRAERHPADRRHAPAGPARRRARAHPGRRAVRRLPGAAGRPHRRRGLLRPRRCSSSSCRGSVAGTGAGTGVPAASWSSPACWSPGRRCG